MNLDLLKKLKALSERGVGGEKDNAAAKLQLLLKKYNLTIDQLEQEEKGIYTFKILAGTKKLFIQIVFCVCGKGPEIYKFAKERGQKRRMQVDGITQMQFVQICEMYEFYKKKYEEDLITFYKAFVHKNELTY